MMKRFWALTAALLLVLGLLPVNALAAETVTLTLLNVDGTAMTNWTNKAVQLNADGSFQTKLPTKDDNDQPINSWRIEGQPGDWYAASYIEAGALSNSRLYASSRLPGFEGTLFSLVGSPYNFSFSPYDLFMMGLCQSPEATFQEIGQALKSITWDALPAGATQQGKYPSVYFIITADMHNTYYTCTMETNDGKKAMVKYNLCLYKDTSMKIRADGLRWDSSKGGYVLSAETGSVATLHLEGSTEGKPLQFMVWPNWYPADSFVDAVGSSYRFVVDDQPGRHYVFIAFVDPADGSGLGGFDLLIEAKEPVGSAPQTGDPSQPLLWTALALLALTGACLCVKKRRQHA